LIIIVTENHWQRNNGAVARFSLISSGYLIPISGLFMLPWQGDFFL
jgi:hypothetical protein